MKHGFQVARGGDLGWGAAPGLNPLRLRPALGFVGIMTSIVEPAAGPAESCLVAAGQTSLPRATLPVHR